MTVRRFWTAAVPLAVMHAYQLIPARIRRLWSFGSSSSTLAIAAVLCGMNGWTALRRYGCPHIRDFLRPGTDSGIWSKWL